MYVQINYTVDLENVPEHISRLLQDVSSSVAGVEEKYNLIKKETSSKKENLTNTLLLIKELRETLVNIDLRLADCQAIAQGYQRAQVEGSEIFEPQLQSSTESTVAVEDFQTDQMIREMEKKTEEKMNELKQTFSTFSSAFSDGAPAEVASSMPTDPSQMQSALIMQKAAAAKSAANKSTKKED